MPSGGNAAGRKDMNYERTKRISAEDRLSV